MKLFVNDIKINIKKDAYTVKQSEFDYIFSTFDTTKVQEWSGKILLLFPNPRVTRVILDILESENTNVKSVTIVSHKPKEFVKQVFKDFSFIDAAGGLVVNNDGKILMIYRNGIWDFPKGKLDKGESIEECAVREVEEECGVKVKIQNSICKTRHTYIGSKKRVFKTTYWYKMALISDAKMKPQIIEGIEKVEWKTMEEVDELLGDSFASLRYLFNECQGLKGTYALTSLPNL